MEVRDPSIEDDFRGVGRRWGWAPLAPCKYCHSSQQRYTHTHTVTHTLHTHTHSHPAHALRHLTPFLSPIKDEQVYITVYRFYLCICGTTTSNSTGKTIPQASPPLRNAVPLLVCTYLPVYCINIYLKNRCPVAFIWVILCVSVENKGLRSTLLANVKHMTQSDYLQLPRCTLELRICLKTESLYTSTSISHSPTLTPAPGSHCSTLWISFFF